MLIRRILIFFPIKNLDELKKLSDKAIKHFTRTDKERSIVYKLYNTLKDPAIVDIITLHKEWIVVVQLRDRFTSKKDEDLNRDLSNFLGYILSHYFSGSRRVDGTLYQIFKTELDYRILDTNDRRMVITPLIRLCDALQKK